MIELKNLTVADIEKRSSLTHEPRWLRMQRREAWQKFLETAEPNWKKAKTPMLDFSAHAKIEFPQKEIPSLKIEKKTPPGYSGKIVLHDGKVLRISLKSELAYKGVIFCDLQTAVLERADLLERYLSGHAMPQDKLEYFQQALWENGFFLFVPKGLVVEEPFQIQCVQANPNRSALIRNVLIMDEGSEAVVEEILESIHESEQTIVCASSSEVFADASARVKYFSTQQWGKNVYDLSLRTLVAKKDAHIRALFSILGAGKGRIKIKGEATEQNAKIEHDGIVIGSRREHFKIIAEMKHNAEYGEGLMRYRGILNDESYSFLDGLIDISPQAKKSSSRLEEHTLLLSDKARCDALPALNIRASDVNVSHSASVSQADQEKLFYLMSRGLSEREAKALIIQGFFEALLEIIPDPAWYQQTKDSIEAKLLIANV